MRAPRDEHIEQRSPEAPVSPGLQKRMPAERDGVGQVDQTPRQMRERDVARDRDLRAVAALVPLDEDDPIAATARGRGVRESLVPDREINEQPVVELAVKGVALRGATGPPQRLRAALPRAPLLTGALEPLLDVLLNESDRPVGSAEANRRDPPILGDVVAPGAGDLQHAGDLAWLEEIGHDVTFLARSS